jgi:hypothetical protein
MNYIGTKQSLFKRYYYALKESSRGLKFASALIIFQTLMLTIFMFINKQSQLYPTIGYYMAGAG